MDITKYLKFVGIAEQVAAMSKDPSTKVGAVALDNSFNILATGYNGFPRRVHDTPERYQERELKYKFIAHAEQNLIAQAAYCGTRLAGSAVIITALFPCSSCAKSLINAGVGVVIAPLIDNARWQEEGEFAKTMFEESGMRIFYYDPLTKLQIK